MRSHDQLDPKREHGVPQPVGTDCRRQARQRLLERTRLWPAPRIALMGAAPADAVVLLGHVGQLEKMRKGSRDRHCGVERHGRELSSKVTEGARRLGPIAPARRLCRGAHTLNASKQIGAFLADEGLAEQAAQQADIIAERLVSVFSEHAAPRCTSRSALYFRD